MNNIDSILVSLPKKVIDFLELRRYFADQVLFYEDTFNSEETPEGFDANIRDRVHRAYFAAADYYKKNRLHMNMVIDNLILEPVKNANFYGGKDLSHTIKLLNISSKKAFIISINDGGEYFKKSDIKFEYENSINSGSQSSKSTLTKEGKKFVGYGLGKEIMFSVTDFRYVDEKLGTLYLGVSTKNKCFQKILS